MKRFSITLPVLVLTLSFTACSLGAASKDNTEEFGDTAGKKTVEAAMDNSGANNAENPDGVGSLSKSVSPDRAKWPKEILHPDMPEYKKGKINGWAPWSSDSNDNIFILIRDTSKEDLEEYRGEMEAAGFTPGNNNGYHKDLYDVELQMDSDAILQISSYKTVPVEWPEALSGIPPVNAGNLTSVDGASEDSPDSITLYYINMAGEKLEDWSRKLAEKGFTVDNGSIIAENIKFNGKTYARANIWYEENGNNEWFIYFEFEK